MISEEDVKRFQELYKKRFGEEISKEDAYQKGVRLVRLMQITLKARSGEKNGERKNQRTL